MKKVGVVAFAFGVPYSIQPNQRIAEIALKKAKEFKAPIYTQFDIFIGFLGIEVTYILQKRGNKPPSTLGIARGAVEWAKELGLENLWIAAALPHLWRCERDIKYAAIEAGVGLQIDIRVCEDIIYKYPESEWYCPQSEQIRTRSSKNWWKREEKLRKVPMFIYKRIAK